MIQEQIYQIFTDASFDKETKLSTYAIVIKEQNKIVKSVAKKCKVQLDNSIECEIYAIYKAINIIESNLMQKGKKQFFYITTDCILALEYFMQKNKNMEAFINVNELSNTIKETYNRVKNKLSSNNHKFSLKWIPRDLNKIAHKQSYSVFKKLKITSIDKEKVLLIEKNIFLELLQKFDSNQFKIISYLFQEINEENLIIKTQSEISKALKLSNSCINRTFRKFINLNILEKVSNGKYTLLM